MLQAPVNGKLVGLLRSWQSRLAAPENRAMARQSVAANRLTWPVLVLVVCAMVAVSIEMWQGVTARGQSPLLPEAVYLGGLVAVVCSRGSRRIWGIIAYAALGIALAILLDAMLGGDWGAFALYGIIVTVVYRLPLRLSLPIFAVCAAVILWSEGLVTLLTGGKGAHWGVIISQSLIIGFAFAASLAQRSRHLLITQLQQTQAQLRLEMARTADLAAARERARIARDMHDVLAHSLTVLSVQAQALRTLIRDHPDRAATMVDQMADVLRESQVESRQMVGLLRETITDEDAANIATRLRVTAERFAERTGVRCTLREHGAATPLSAQQIEALRFALQEALTNAYRHGRASHAEADLWWEPAMVRLSVRNDGAAPTTIATTDTTDDGSGNGLRGMRERATALAGTVTAGPSAYGGGYEISMTLPLDGAPDVASEGATR